MIEMRRCILPGDPAEAFVIDTLVRSYTAAANGGRAESDPRELAHLVFAELNAATTRKVMADWLHTRLAEGAKLWLAHTQEDPNLFVGWLCASPGVLHYIYVKRNFRRQGMAAGMLNAVSTLRRPDDIRGTLRHCSVMTWPWVELWLERNGVTYLPTREHEDGDRESRRAG